MVYQGAMDHAAATRPMPMSLPNVLTYGRILAVPALVACLFFLQGDVGALVGLRAVRAGRA